MRISLSNLKRPGTSAALFLILLCLFTLGLRLRNLDRLSLWMDEGFYVLAAEEILEHGYPLYPSGHILYKGILYGYLLSLVSLIFGFSASSLRAFSVATSVAVIPLFYLFAKKFAGRARPGGMLLLAFSAWETEYARTVIYFAPLQLIYLAGLYFFYRGFFENRKKDKIAAAIVFFLAPHIHQLAMGLFLLRVSS
jgi:4-amino-4-deoxy-L-arabinose transferase-like glycosyltransferase